MLARIRLIDDTQTYLTLTVELTNELLRPALNIESPLNLHVELALPLALDVLADGTQWLAEIVLVPTKFVSLTRLERTATYPFTTILSSRFSFVSFKISLSFSSSGASAGRGGRDVSAVSRDRICACCDSSWCRAARSSCCS